MADKQSRKWQITINNPADKGLDHDVIKATSFKACQNGNKDCHHQRDQ